MYHPTRGGVRGGRDQFQWDDVKVDKHRENYLGHSIMAPVGRWQKGKDLHWYARDKKAAALDAEAAKEEIKRIKEEEEQAMREALGLAPKRVARTKGNKLDKHEYAELIKRESTAEDLGAGHAEAAQIQGVGLYKGRQAWAEMSSLPVESSGNPPESESKSVAGPVSPRGPKEGKSVAGPVSPRGPKEASEEDLDLQKKRRREERREERERRSSKHEKKRSRDSDDKRKHRRDKDRRRHDSDSN